ncbi:MAG: hypothetical protein R2710_09815 [Acidimicrobiales bacterium]
MIDALEQVLADDLLDGLTTPSEEVRSLRTQCAQVEADVSFARRVVQGRLDIIGYEARRRNGDADAADALPGLLFDLPSLMTDEPRPGAPTTTPGARPVSINAPGDVAAALVERLDAVASPGKLTGVGTMSDAELAELLDRMRAYEIELSTVRRRLHDRIDAFQSEIGRRYRDGEASVDSLLR